MNTDLIRKYNVAGPRYTSYPTVPYWEESIPAGSAWEQRALRTFLRSNQRSGISLYIHLPYCESLCTYCGCNTRITKNHTVELPYILGILNEWSRYLALFGATPRLSELHLGGGTPTFFSPANLERLIEGILATVITVPGAAFSFEGHPANTTREHLTTLYRLGFRRVSFGIQDFDPVVQETIHRFQSVQQVEEVTRLARDIGYTSVNYDLVYGLPFQEQASIQKTLREVIRMRPDRIAFYSYAHVPWIKPGQRKFSEADLPSGPEKQALYETGRTLLEGAGYRDVGMDHFALPDDALFAALKQKRLNRNFMGYTTSASSLLVGLGTSAISDFGTAYVQNEKTVEGWLRRINAGEWAWFRGHLLTREDRILRRHIRHLMCRMETSWKNPLRQCGALYEALERLDEPEADGLVERRPYHLKITAKGRPFVRNICMAFDARLWSRLPQTELFSGTV